MINLKFFTPNGLELETQSDSITVYDIKNGSFGILENHVPTISCIIKGYISYSADGVENFVALSNAMVKFLNNELSVVSDALVKCDSRDNAIDSLDEFINTRKEENRERNVELALAENELKKQIKKTGAGKM